MKETIKTEVETTIIKCDSCGESQRRMNSCHICHRDLCDKHLTLIFGINICGKCHSTLEVVSIWNRNIEINKQIEILENTFYTERENLDKQQHNLLDELKELGN